MIQTKRLLATLCARKNAVVHLCVDSSLEPLARLVYPDVVTHPIMAHGTGLSKSDAKLGILVGNRKAFAKLKSINFETVYNLNFSGLNFRMASLFDPDQVKGYAWHNGQEMIGLWPSMAMRWAAFRRISINLVDFWAGYCPDMVAPESVNPEAKGKGGGIGVVLAGRESRRSLPPAVLAKIASTMGGANKIDRIMLLGSKSEKMVGQAVLKELPVQFQRNAKNLAGKTDWSELVGIVDSLDILLTPDTGTMHLAAHLGTPVKAFFLSSAWSFETGPYGKGHTVYQAMADCLPCLETKPCDRNVNCLESFIDPMFQRFLVTGKPEHAPAGLLGLKPAFDQLGQFYVSFAGNDPEFEQRMKFRNFIYQYLSGANIEISDLDNMFAQRIYRERDWVSKTRIDVTFG